MRPPATELRPRTDRRVLRISAFHQHGEADMPMSQDRVQRGGPHPHHESRRRDGGRGEGRVPRRGIWNGRRTKFEESYEICRLAGRAGTAQRKPPRTVADDRSALKARDTNVTSFLTESPSVGPGTVIKIADIKPITAFAPPVDRTYPGRRRFCRALLADAIAVVTSVTSIDARRSSASACFLGRS